MVTCVQVPMSTRTSEAGRSTPPWYHFRGWAAPPAAAADPTTCGNILYQFVNVCLYCATINIMGILLHHIYWQSSAFHGCNLYLRYSEGFSVCLVMFSVQCSQYNALFFIFEGTTVKSEVGSLASSLSRGSDAPGRGHGTLTRPLPHIETKVTVSNILYYPFTSSI